MERKWKVELREERYILSAILFVKGFSEALLAGNPENKKL